MLSISVALRAPSISFDASMLLAAEFQRADASAANLRAGQLGLNLGNVPAAGEVECGFDDGPAKEMVSAHKAPSNRLQCKVPRGAVFSRPAVDQALAIIRSGAQRHRPAAVNRPEALTRDYGCP